MDKKIIMTMVLLLVVALVAVMVVLATAGGGIHRAGGFTELFDKLQYTGAEHEDQRLVLPESWNAGDKKSVSDSIVDMSYRKQTVSQTTVYITTLWFVYMGQKWSYPYQSDGMSFYVPDTSADGWFHVSHGLFSITVSSATNLSSRYDVGEVISVETMLVTNSNAMLAFGEWAVSDTL
jgi:hypothetical protein